MRITRRWFVKSSGLAAVAVGCGAWPLPGFVARAARATAASGRTLIVLFLRGAADGLNIVVPHAERAYYARRPSIAVPRPRRGDAATAIDLDGTFGLHPALAPLKRFWDERLLAVVHAAGSPHATRSHFDAQDFMESGTPGVKSTRDGWLNRTLAAAPRREPSPFRAVALTPNLPRALAGEATALAVPELSQFGIGGGARGEVARAGLESLYADADPLLATTAGEAFEAIELLRRADPAQYRPAEGARYPPGAFGRSLAQIAQLVKAGVGLEIAFAELDGWDHHVNEGGVAGPLADRLRPLAEGVAALLRDLDSRMDDVLLITLSEFGRTVAENGNRGTDHGHANAMFVAGRGVRGGRLHGEWPGLEPEQLFEGRDLALTTDFRDVAGLALARHLGCRDLDRVFPGRRNETPPALAGLIS